MKIALVYGRREYLDNEGLGQMCRRLEAAGHSVAVSSVEAGVGGDSDLVLSVGGDGTFLHNAVGAARNGKPVLGVNLGHLGFLSENTPEAVADAILKGSFRTEERSLLRAVVNGSEYLALNEICVHRNGSAMLGVKVTYDDNVLPTYWADGLLVATPSGSTAYSLSAGGPIVTPTAKVLIIVPIAPHNLNVRPLIVPLESRISLEFVSRNDTVMLSADKNSGELPVDARVDISVAQFSLKRICLGNSTFAKALSEKLFWGEDKRNF